MKNMVHKHAILKSVLLLLFIILPLLGSDCNNTTTTQNSGNISGNWQLNFVQGNLQDVCVGEVVNFPSNTGGTATLTCPGQTPLSQQYTFSNDQLNYTATNVTYTVNSSSPGVLILTGTYTNTGGTGTRILTYGTVTTGKSIQPASPNKSAVNSSEQILSK